MASDIPSEGPPPSPGMKNRHYAPKDPVYLMEGSPDEQANLAVFHAAGYLGRKGCSFSLPARMPPHTLTWREWPEI